MLPAVVLRQTVMSRWQLGRLLPSLVAVAVMMWPLVAMADIAPQSGVRSTLIFIDVFVLAPFSGLFLLAYISVLMRRSCLPGMPSVALLNVLGGALLTTTDPTLGAAQALIFILGFSLDRVVRRAVARVDAEDDRPIDPQESFISLPSMTPVPTTDVHDSTISAAARSSQDE